MPLPSWISTLFEPAAKIVDELHTSQEERGQIRLALLEAQMGMAQKAMEYELGLAEAKKTVIVAEAAGESWLQRNWRPILMLAITSILTWNYIVVGIGAWLMALIKPMMPPPPPLVLPADLWTLLQIGVGGYIVGRSAEKIADTVSQKGISFGKSE